MPFLRQRVRSGEQQDSTVAGVPEPVESTAAAAPGSDVTDVATPNPTAVESEVPEPQPDSAPATPPVRVARTRISGAWVAAVVAVVALIFLLIFILQNLSRARVSFLGASGTLPMGVAMLFAAVGGALLIALFGSARVLQLRRTVRRRRSEHR